MHSPRQFGRIKKVLICKPTHLAQQAVDDTARMFMQLGDELDLAQANREHERFIGALLDCLVEVQEIAALRWLPHQVYTRDLGVMTSEGLILGKFKESFRDGESDLASKVLSDHYPIWEHIKSEDMFFEGGDFIYIDNQHVALGVGSRTNWAAARHLQERCRSVGLKIIPVSMDAKFVHLDMLFNVVAERICVLCPEKLPQEFVDIIADMHFEMIRISPSQARTFGANLLSIDGIRVISTKHNSEVNEALHNLGMEVIVLEIKELLRGGGGPHCLALPLEWI